MDIIRSAPAQSEQQHDRCRSRCPSSFRDVIYVFVRQGLKIPSGPFADNQEVPDQCLKAPADRGDLSVAKYSFIVADDRILPSIGPDPACHYVDVTADGLMQRRQVVIHIDGPMGAVLPDLIGYHAITMMDGGSHVSRPVYIMPRPGSCGGRSPRRSFGRSRSCRRSPHPSLCRNPWLTQCAILRIFSELRLFQP